MGPSTALSPPHAKPAFISGSPCSSAGNPASPAGCTATAYRPSAPPGPALPSRLRATTALWNHRPSRAPQRDPAGLAEPSRHLVATRGRRRGDGTQGPRGAGSTGGTAAEERCLPRRRGHVASPDFACHVTAGPRGPGRCGGARWRRLSAGSRWRGGARGTSSRPLLPL